MSGPPFDPYRILGISRGARPAEIGRAYRRRAKELHPDLHGADGVAAMRELNRAVRILSDPATRHAWDAASATRRQHWAAAPAGRPVAEGAPDPAAWAPWEAQPVAGAAPVRTRPAGSWPREGVPTVPAGGIRDSAWLAVVVALAIVVVALVLGWIASSGTLPRSGREAIARLGVTPIGGYLLDPDHEVGVFLRSTGVIGLVAAERQENGGWTARVLTEVTTSHPLSVLLFVDEATAGSALPSIAFGRAEGGVAEVRVRGADDRRATVVQGTWSMPLPGISDPGQLGWEFVLADGTVVEESGELSG